MESGSSNRREVKAFCAAFVSKQIADLNEQYHRLLRCECAMLGAEGCTCDFNKDVPDTSDNNGYQEPDSEQADGYNYDTSHHNGVATSQRGQLARLGLLKSNKKHSWQSQSLDEGERSAIAKMARLNITHIPRMRHLPVALPPQHHDKLIRCPSFMDQIYDGVKNPYVLVINNVNFLLKPAPRSGASADMHNLQRFLDKAGFMTRAIHYDLTRKEMTDVFEAARQDPILVDHDGFICVIMSHGGKNGILTNDLNFVDVDEITGKFQGTNCPQLATKPKLFFIQACRGDDVDKGYVVSRGHRNHHHEEELPVTLPSEADFLIAYSTTKGKVSFRRYTPDCAYMEANLASMGSWFISCLVDVLLAYSHREDLMSMLTRVNHAMASLYSNAGNKQMACQLSMLTKKLYFANLMEKEDEGND